MAFHILDATKLERVTIATVVNPVESEIDVRFEFQEEISQPQLRGRLTGPHSPYASTVEIAHPIRPLPRAERTASATVDGRIVIPEPSLWNPQAPFLYEGEIELWSSGQPLVRLGISQGLCTQRIDADGLRCNGKHILLQGVEVGHVDETSLVAWRRLGRNTLLAPANAQAKEVCALADGYGFIALLILSNDTSWEHLALLAEHTCCFGWIARQDLLRDELFHERVQELVNTCPRQALGMWLEQPLDACDLSKISFLYVDAQSLDHRLPEHLSKLVHAKQLEQPPGGADVFGCVQRSAE
jgi:hypothetical protein